MDNQILCYEKLKSYLPLYLYSDSELILSILETSGINLDELYQQIFDFRNQLNVDSATWGLDFFEEELGINTDGLIEESENQRRRERIKLKYRGYGKVDALLIKLVTDACTNGAVDVTFDKEIKIKFNGIYGTPANLQDLKNALEDIKPAHLSISYTYRYLLINEVHNKLAINDINKRYLNDFAGGTK